LDSRRSVFTGFDSAWTATNQGAIAHVTLVDGLATLVPPAVAGFDAALDHIQELGRDFDLHVIGIDQPLIVPNLTGCRPVERVLGALISRYKGGMQPANRSKSTMFGDGAPIWPFLRVLDADIDWRHSVGASSGRFAIEVYPAAALAGLFPSFVERGWLAKYNPANGRKFSLDDWSVLCGSIGELGQQFGILGVQEWCRGAAVIQRPRKSDQDKLDAVICVLIAFQWWKWGNGRSVVVGDLETGYIVTPASDVTEEIVRAAAELRRVPFWGMVSSRG
jgi:predicted RNase H-like nuclease